MNKSLFLFLLLFNNILFAQPPKGNDVTAPLHALQPDYVVPYKAPTIPEVKSLLDRIFHYLDSVTPTQFVDRRSGKVVTDLTTIDTNTILKRGDYRLTSYEWGVTYSGMIRVGEVTGDAKFTDYTNSRVNFISGAIPSFKSLWDKYPQTNNALKQPVFPEEMLTASSSSLQKALEYSGV